jgi:hypothetical protein
MTALFSAADLTVPLGRAVTDEEAALAERVVWGWLKPGLGLTERPDPIPDEVFSWAIELGAIYLENPSGLSSKQLGAEQMGFSAERRTAILAEVGEGRLGPGSPRGSFPLARPWPDRCW